jgi:hypothetical protein
MMRIYEFFDIFPNLFIGLGCIYRIDIINLYVKNRDYGLKINNQAG